MYYFGRWWAGPLAHCFLDQSPVASSRWINSRPRPDEDAHSSPRKQQAFHLDRSNSWTCHTFTPSNTAYSSIPGLLKEMHPLRLLKCYSTFSSNVVFTVPRGKGKSALPPEPRPQLVFIAEMFTLRKPLVHIILPLVGYSHLYCSQSFSYGKVKSWQCAFHFSYHS